MNTDDRLVTIKQACVLADVLRRTIYNWMTSGRLEYVRTAGGSPRIVQASLFRSPTPPQTHAPV